MPAAKAPKSLDYDRFKSRQAEDSRRRSAEGREIGEIPRIESPRRRGRCRGSLRRFCETYNPEAFYLGWSPSHLRAIARIEEAVTAGALYAMAMPRGSGKTTICRMAALWAIAYAHCRYAFVIGATDPKAQDTLDSIRTMARFLPLFGADFPEVSYPAQKLAGIAQRAGGQTCRGESTQIEWSSDRVVLATVPPPENWPRSWPLRDDGMVPSSGSVLSASGLTGEGIRGSLLTLRTGDMIRPDFVLLDDPQTPESARSPTQNAMRERLISADVLGMAGPGRTISAVMPCTVIERADMIDRMLDRAKHPLWRGDRTQLLPSMPTNMAAWERYFEVYRRCAQQEPPDLAAANAHYVEHRDELDAGAVADWPDRRLPGEVSAIQSAMHLYCRDPKGFWAEYQNRPLPRTEATSAGLDADAVGQRSSNVPRRTVPRNCTRITAMVDVGAHLLWYAVVAWDERFGGQVLDAGAYPDQERSYFGSSEARLTLPVVHPGLGQDAAIYAGLTAVASSILGRSYPAEETGGELRVERCLVDANWGPATDLVYDWARRSPYAAQIVCSHGKFVGASTAPMGSWQVRPGERAGPGWRLTPMASGRGRHVTFDANHWKSFVAARLSTPRGAAGGLWLWAPGERDDHRLIADHCTAEYPVEVTGRGRTVAEWKSLPGRDNHLWDCLVGAAVAASVQGVRFSGGAAPAASKPTPAPAGKPSLNEEKKRRRAEKAATRDRGEWVED